MVQYYEDLDTGVEFDIGTFILQKDEIIKFAERFDPQPFHVDEQAASESIFGQLIASGLHTLCVATRVFTEDYLQAEDSVAIMGGVGINQLRWHQPVTPGQELTLSVEIWKKSDVDCRPDRGYVDFKRTVMNPDREPVMTDQSRGIIEKSPK